jgi:uncharacterized membrane protein YoaK (UPF0700 family)
VSRDEAAQLALAMVLTAIAGWVDAIGFLRLGGLFVSFMSGDTTEMASAFAHGRLVEGWAIAGLLLLFVMGSFAGRLVAEAAGAWRRPAGLILTASLLSIGVLLGLAPGQAALVTGTAAMVLAMGVQSAAIARLGDVKASLTSVTGTLVRIGETLADAVTGTGRLAEVAPYVAMWLGLALGAFGGALAYGRVEMAALLVPAAAAALLALHLGGQVRRTPNNNIGSPS